MEGPEKSEGEDDIRAIVGSEGNKTGRHGLACCHPSWEL